MFFDTLRHCIQEGGDTEANSTIVGGMLGALVGLDHIPKHMLEKVLKSE
jgi:ADP-ribosylglycohydrolase